MTKERAKRKLTAILSADVKGYSRLMGEDEKATVETLKTYRDVIGELIRQYRGRVVDSPGDNVLSEFASVVDAVECAVKVQEELKTRNEELPENRRMEFRIGVHHGDVIEDEGRIYGDGVNIAARIEGLAEGGGICISRTSFDSVKNKLDLGFEYLGEHSVKNIAEPVRVYKVLREPEYVGKVIGEERPRPKHWRWAAIAAVLIIAAGALAIWNFYFRLPEIEPASVDKMAFSLPEKPSIAVLPFINMSADPNQEYFSDGITEEIITALSKVQNIFVIARNSTFTYKDRPVKVQQVSEELGVQYVLEGSVRHAEDRMRITAQLVNAVTGHHLWAERYDRKLEDIFAVQDEITKRIIIELQVNLTEGEQARIYAKGTDNLEAYLKFLKARELLMNFKPENQAQIRQLSQEIIELVPNWPFGYWCLGATHIMDYFYGLSKTPQKSVEQAYELLQKSSALDENLGVTQHALSIIYTLKGQHKKAIEHGRRAVKLEPNGADFKQNLARILMNAGRPQESIPLYEQALRLNPYAPVNQYYNYGYALWMIGKNKEALEAGEEALRRGPNDIFSHILLAACYSELGRDEDATASATELLKIKPDTTLEWLSKMLPWKNKDDVERLVGNLRKAGLPDKSALPLPDKPSIAVLPFVNMSDDPKQEYFSDGITEEIITALSKVPDLFVIARNSTFTYKGKPTKVQKVGRELGVKYVLEGSVRKAGDKVRVTAQLVDAKTGNHLWAERYDREFKDIFALQDEITMKIITALEVKLTEGEQATIQVKGTRNLDAYLKYLQAREYIRLINRDDNIRAQKIAEEIIALDPNYSGGYRSLAFVEINNVWFGWSKSPKESLMRAIKLAKKAIEIEDSSGPHRVLAYVYILFRKHDKAIEEARKALDMEPNSADAHNDLGHVLFQADAAEEAVSVLKRAIRLNPHPPSMYFHNLAWAYHSLGKYEEAINSAKNAIHVNQKDIVAHRALVSCYSLLGREKDARAEAVKVLQIDPNFSVDRFAKMSPLKNKDKAKEIWDSYRKAGLK